MCTSFCDWLKRFGSLCYFFTKHSFENKTVSFLEKKIINKKFSKTKNKKKTAIRAKNSARSAPGSKPRTNARTLLQF